MDKKTFFMEAMKAGLYKRKDWIIDAFSVSFTKEDEQKYLLKIINQEDGKRFYVASIDENNQAVLEPLTGAVPGEPLFSFKEKIEVPSGSIPNLKVKQSQPISTTYGNVLFNYIALVWPFGNKIPFMTGEVDTSAIEKIIASRLTDNVPQEERVESDDPTSPIYVDELIRYGQAIGFLRSLSTLVAPAASPKTLTVDPAIIKRRDELLEQYKDQLDDPTVIAKIQKELTEMDKASFKGDPAEGFFIKDKTFNVSRMKMYIMHGRESGFGNTGIGESTITTSLNEGWDIDKMPAYINSLRSGSYSRGKQTELGGVVVKELSRAFQNTKIAEDDCGVQKGMRWLVTEANCDLLVGAYPVGKGTSSITEEQCKSLIGKEIELRTPMLCKTPGVSFCARCIGDRYNDNPNGLTVAAFNVGSVMMSIFMAAMHGKALKTAKLKLAESIS